MGYLSIMVESGGMAGAEQNWISNYLFYIPKSLNQTNILFIVVLVRYKLIAKNIIV